MKKVFLTMALAGAALCAQAQIQVGPKVGLNVSTLNIGIDSYDGVDIENSPVVGLNIGVAASYSFTDMFSFAPELIFTQKGGKLGVSESGSDGGQSYSYSYEETNRMNFLEAPLLVRATFGSGLKGYVNAGPSIGYWLGGTYKETKTFSSGGSSETKTESGDIVFVDAYTTGDTDNWEVLRSDAKRLGIGASIGGGVVLPVQSNNLLVDVRYTAPLGDLMKIYADDDYKNFRTGGFSLSAIFLFGLK